MFAPAVVSMVSILENTQSQIKFYILERQTLPISRINRAKLDNLKQKYSNFSVEYISVDPDDFREMIPIDTYFRYIVPDVVPDLKKAVYLDVDIIVQSDIAELYNMPLDDYYIGAVNHPKEYWERFPLFYEIVFNLKLDNPYFYVNGGVMLFNCGKYREDKISNLLKEKTRLYKEKIKWADQDLKNCLGNSIHCLMLCESTNIRQKKRKSFILTGLKNLGTAICSLMICFGNMQKKHQCLLN